MALPKTKFQQLKAKTATPTDCKLAAQRAEALELRIQGKTFDEIAKAIGLSDGSCAYLTVEAALKYLREEPPQAFVRYSLMRLDKMRVALWPKITRGSIAAILALLKVEEREAKLLGLDAPSKIDLEFRIREMAVEAGLDPDEAVLEASRAIKCQL